MSVNAAHQQFSKVASQWKTTQNSVSQIQKEQQQKNAKLPLIKAVQKGIYYKTQKLQKSVVLQKTSLNMNVNEDNCQPKIKKSNNKTAVITSVSEPVRAPVSACMMK